ncbi:MAG: 3-hydroxyacyl-CoA dehydrogenase NAD-binding domain-containing protein, partial [Terriglobales bacterium]
MSNKFPVAIIGAGAMGTGIAQIAAAAGHPVRIFDSRRGAAETASEAIRAMYAKLAGKGKMSPRAADDAGGLLVPAKALAELADAGLALEAIVENLEEKRKLFAALEALVSPDCLLATNTSSLAIPDIAVALQAPQRLTGMHFFNPVPLMDLVEVVGG